MWLAHNKLNTPFSFQEEYKALKEAFFVEGEGFDAETMVVLLEDSAAQFHPDNGGHWQSDPAPGGRSSYVLPASSTIGSYLFS